MSTCSDQHSAFVRCKRSVVVVQIMTPILYPTLPSGGLVLGSRNLPSQISIAPGKLSSARFSTCSTKRFLASSFLLLLMMSCSGSITTHWWTTSLCKDSKCSRDPSSCNINLSVFIVGATGNKSLQRNESYRTVIRSQQGNRVSAHCSALVCEIPEYRGVCRPLLCIAACSCICCGSAEAAP